MNNQSFTPINGHRESVSFIDKHSFICDLIDIEGPLLSLYRDQKRNWFYLWCDTNNIDRERWLVFEITRPIFASYLDRSCSLLDCLTSSKTIYCLEKHTTLPSTPDTTSKVVRSIHRVIFNAIKQYHPSNESYFDPKFAPDLSLNQEILPTRFEVPIGGDWFITDLDKFCKTYSNLYAFFYCTKPRFVGNIIETLRKALTAPWEGGFSRVHLFHRLSRSIPSFHDMRIRQMEYASPGKVAFEALGSVGQDIKQSLDFYIVNKVAIELAAKRINDTLSVLKVRRVDLSKFNNNHFVDYEEEISIFQNSINTIANLLSIEAQLSLIEELSPNSVVAAKATLALLTPIQKLAEYEVNGLLNITGRGALVEGFEAKDNWLENQKFLFNFKPPSD